MKLEKKQLSLINKAMRFLWHIVYLLVFRPTPIFLHPWRIFILRQFGAKIDHGAHVYPNVKIWAPWNLVMGKDSCLAGDVDCYNVALVTLGEGATVSQYSYLCTASRDYRDPSLPLIVAPITLGPKVWVAADVFIGPGVTIGKGSVVSARASIFKNVAAGVLAKQKMELIVTVI